MALHLQLPDGAVLPLSDEGLVLGRKHMREHPSVSRSHIFLQPVPGLQDAAVRLEVLGSNPVIVEVPREGQTHSLDAVYVTSDYLDPGGSTLMGPGARFYVASLQQDTCCTLLVPRPPTGTSAAAAAAATEGVGSKRLRDDAGDGAYAWEPATSPAKRQQQSSGGGAFQTPYTPPGAPPAAAAAGSGASPPAAAGLAAGAATPAGPLNTAAAAGQGSRGSSQQPIPLEASPISLMHVRGLSPQVNSGALGVPLWHLVTGNFTTIFIANYMIDLPWLLSACPDILGAQRVWIAHGEHGDRAGGIKATAAAAGLGAGPAAAAAAGGGGAGVGSSAGGVGLQDAPAGAAAAAAAGGGGGGGAAAAAAAGANSGAGLCCWAPPLPIAWGTHHSKAFILGYPTGLRVIIITANLLYGDCNRKTQALWWQDFPVKSADSPVNSPFERDLTEYLRATQPPPSIAAELLGLVAAHDLSSARVALLASVPGYHSGAELHKWGHMRLRALLASQQLPGRFKDQSMFLAQFSSLGSIDSPWLLQEWGASASAGQYSSGGDGGEQPSSSAAGMAAAAGSSSQQQPGLPGTGGSGSGSKVAASSSSSGRQSTLPTASSSSSSRGPAPTPGPPLSPAGLQLVWPTVDEVRNSLEGWVAGRSVPGPSKNVYKPFLSQFWHKWGGEAAGRQRAMPHIKSYLRYLPPAPPSTAAGAAAGAAAAGGAGAHNRPTSPSLTTPPAPTAAAAAAAGGTGRQHGAEVAWMAVCSHNLSKAAWGALQKGGTQLMVRSYELGVLALPSLEAAYRTHPHAGFRAWPVPGEVVYQSAAGRAAAASSSAAGTAAAAQVGSGGAAAAAATAGASAAGGSGALSAACPQQQQQQQEPQAAVPVRFWAFPYAATPGSAAPSALTTTTTTSSSSSSSSRCDVVLPIPYRLPPQRYCSPGDQPWVWDADHPGLDVLGRTCNQPASLYGHVQPPGASE